MRPSIAFVLLSLGILLCAVGLATGVLPVSEGDAGAFGEMRHSHLSAVMTNAVFVVVGIVFLVGWIRLIYCGGALWRPALRLTNVRLQWEQWTKLGEVLIGEADCFLAWVFPERPCNQGQTIVIRLDAIDSHSSTHNEGAKYIERNFANRASGPRRAMFLRTHELEPGSYSVSAQLKPGSQIASDWTITLGTGPSILKLPGRAT